MQEGYNSEGVKTFLTEELCLSELRRFTWINAYTNWRNYLTFKQHVERMLSEGQVIVKWIQDGRGKTGVETLQISVSQIVLPADHFRLRKITTDAHILAHMNVGCPDDRYPKLKICISGPILDSYENMSVSYIKRIAWCDHYWTDCRSLRGYWKGFLIRY